MCFPLEGTSQIGSGVCSCVGVWSKATLAHAEPGARQAGGTQAGGRIRARLLGLAARWKWQVQ